jgi:hypothetical protein
VFHPSPASMAAALMFLIYEKMNIAILRLVKTKARA